MADASSTPYFYAWETVDLPITLSKEGCLVGAEKVIVSISQDFKTISRDDAIIDAEHNSIMLSLSQYETGEFVPGTAYIQVNILYSNGKRDTSERGAIEVRKNLYREVMK